MIPLESLRLVNGDEIDGSLLIADEMRGLYTDIVPLDHREELDSICEHEKWFLPLVIAYFVHEFCYVGERTGLELVLYYFCTIIVR